MELVASSPPKSKNKRRTAAVVSLVKEAIAKTLDIDVKKAVLKKGLLNDLYPEAIQTLKNKPITERALKIHKRVKALRKIEMTHHSLRFI